MTLTLDTSVLIKIERNDANIKESISKIRQRDPFPPFITFAAYFEFIQGIRERNPKNKDKANRFVDLFKFLQPTKATANILNDIKYKYEKSGNPFTLSDLFIAAQCIENNLTLVTTDKQFEGMEELKKIIL